MRVLLVDDERLARAELRRLLAAHPVMEIVGEAVSAADAVTQIAALRPDLLLLDVQMPGGSGFDLLASLDNVPDVIFTTAFDRFALQAFEVNALDYLQKPIQPARMAAALARAAQRRQAAAAVAAAGAAAMPAAPTEPPAPHKIFIKDGERCWFVALHDIRLFESEGNYTRVYFDGQQPLMLRTLTQLEEKLDPQRFFRASRRHIVNLDCVRSVAPNDAGGLDLVLQGGPAVEVSRRRAAQFKLLSSL
ncbi:two-component system response regulator [Massilia sp. Root351]|jgi:two-component system LytT family response regulator|uniref:LytR/AlgR family response regulator transcription factor n=1 Tax=Massilia sp. Root351 TaxID=1736522 RepID=UPI00070AD86D|nr:LytTR family DNA-binding domain-containing protein [Massilia sp. Root351]KQV78416.1 two-component system response regulator [Massilia sp. Root351]